MLTFLVISYRLWLCAKDSICAAKLQIYTVLGRNLLHYTVISAPQYGGQKAIDTHRYKLLQLVLSGDATPL